MKSTQCNETSQKQVLVGVKLVPEIGLAWPIYINKSSEPEKCAVSHTKQESDETSLFGEC